MTAGDVERTVSAMAGAALVVRGAVRRDLAGWLAIAAGSTLIVRGVAGKSLVPRTLALPAAAEEAEIVRSVTVGATPEAITSLLLDPSKWLPGEVVAAVSVVGERWRVDYGLGPLRGEWEATVRPQPGGGVVATSETERSALQSIEVELLEAPDARGCEMRVCVMPDRSGIAGRSLQAFRGVAERMLGHALQRFRQVLETGEVARNEPQPHGRRGALARVVRARREAS